MKPEIVKNIFRFQIWMAFVLGKRLAVVHMNLFYLFHDGRVFTYKIIIKKTNILFHANFLTIPASHSALLSYT